MNVFLFDLTRVAHLEPEPPVEAPVVLLVRPDAAHDREHDLGRGVTGVGVDVEVAVGEERGCGRRVPDDQLLSGFGLKKVTFFN